ncbi:large ribosomal subunit protein mL49 [Onthophagus taurus]|uniref:large ribosomal subunit protein mL49 n=1 Tax=Onthophagus taurus TaxID=166361 RepID=UPI000C1FE301|nr:probable 39S ribosomal protein L49, mitochondrial [Onthophagus taurus]
MSSQIMVSLINKLNLLPLITNSPSKIINYNQLRYSSFRSSPFISDLETPNVKYEVTKDPHDWKFVERLLPPTTVPKPTLKNEYPSDWKPQSLDATNLPYFIQRTKNHMIPVYMKTSNRGMKRLTYVKKIQRDIWRLENELREFLQKENKNPIRSQVNELVGYICFHGDHVNAIKYYLMKKNL